MNLSPQSPAPARAAAGLPSEVGGLHVSWTREASGPARGRGERFHYAWFDSPVGPMLVAGDDHDIVAIMFLGGGTREEQERWMRSRWPGADFRRDRERLLPLVERLRATGEAQIRLTGTEYQLRVWAELLRIPNGERRTYEGVARRLGLGSTHARSVAGAIGANPVSWLVPCHRVVGSNGTLGGYSAGLEVKRALLDREGGPPPTG